MKEIRFLLFTVLLNIAAASAVVDYANGYNLTDTLDLDKIPPNSYMESAYGWYDHAVTAKLTAVDAHSGIAALSYMIDGTPPGVSYTGNAELLLSTEGIHRIEYSSIDNAGNVENPKMSLVKIDISAPEISILTPSRRSYLHSDIIAFDFSGKDELSGIFSINGKIDGNPVTSSNPFDMLDLIPGVHEFEVLALDNAGNAGLSKVKFTVVSNIDSLMALNSRAVGNGWISGADLAGRLSQELILAKQEIESGHKEKGNDILKSYINEISSQKGKIINEYGADILINEAAYVYILNVS